MSLSRATARVALVYARSSELCSYSGLKGHATKREPLLSKTGVICSQTSSPHELKSITAMAAWYGGARLENNSARAYGCLRQRWSTRTAPGGTSALVALTVVP